MTNFGDFMNYVSERKYLRISYDNGKGSQLRFDNTRLAKMKDQSINCLLHHLLVTKGKFEYIDIKDVLSKEQDFRKIRKII